MLVNDRRIAHILPKHVSLALQTLDLSLHILSIFLLDANGASIVYFAL